MEDKQKDFFVSYTQQDKLWALWIAGTLEMNGYSTIVQAWDFKSGENFVLNMDDALKLGKRFIAVLSRAYLESPYCKAEWTAAFTKDPAMKNASFIPVRIEDVKIEGLLAPVAYIDLFGKNEKEAEKILLAGVYIKEPSRERPEFPGTKPRPRFPGNMPFNNLPARPLRFTGRQEILENIHRTFEKKEAIALTQAISGMGGIGKTQIALEYAYRYRSEYDCVWWLNAETEETIFASFQEFALKTKIIDDDVKETKIIIAAVRHWMQQTDNWLFIYDNVEDETKLKPYLPVQSHGRQHILITSRNTQFLNYTPINISVFTEAEACEFIEKYTNKPADEHFKELAEKMGRLPLALDQAGAYMAIHKKSYEEYLNLYNKKSLALLKTYKVDNEKKTVATTWMVSFEKINNSAAKQLLNLCAFFAPDIILKAFFTLANEVLPDELRKAVSDEMDYDDILAELTKYSLITLNENGFFSIHRLVQEVIRDSLKEKQAEWRTYCVSILNEIIYFDFSTAESRELFRILASHILVVTNEDATEEIAWLYHFLGYGYDELADYSQSLTWYEKALVIREKVLGKEYPDTATIYNNIAEVYRKQGQYDKALEYYEKSLVIFKNVFGNEHPNTATIYNNMAAVYDKKGDYDKALEYYEKALAICKNVLGKEHPYTASTYNNIALVYDNQGDYDKALEYFEKSLAISEKVLGKEHPNTATTYHNMAGVYGDQGDYDKALEYHDKALAIREKVLGKEHPDTATTYHNMAAVYDKKGDYDKALEYYEKSLAIREKVLGKEHPDTAATYNGMASAYGNIGDYDKALEYNEKTLSIREKFLGKKHPHTANSYNNIAKYYSGQGQYDLALEYYIKSLTICVKVLGFEHPNTELVLNNMFITYEASGKSEPFGEWFEKNLDLV